MEMLTWWKDFFPVTSRFICIARYYYYYYYKVHKTKTISCCALHDTSWFRVSEPQSLITSLKCFCKALKWSFLQYEKCQTNIPSPTDFPIFTKLAILTAGSCIMYVASSCLFYMPYYQRSVFGIIRFSSPVSLITPKASDWNFNMYIHVFVWTYKRLLNSNKIYSKL